MHVLISFKLRNQIDLLCSIKSRQSCPTLWPPWTIAHQAPLSMGILQAKVLEWVAMPSSRGSCRPRDQTRVSYIAGRFFTTEPSGKPLIYLRSLHTVQSTLTDGGMSSHGCPRPAAHPLVTWWKDRVGVVFIYLAWVYFSTRFTFLIMPAYINIKMCL